MELYCGKWEEVLPTITTKIDAIATDPPYGAKDTHNFPKYTRQKKEWKPIVGDDQPFDPTPWLKYPKVALFGYHRFAPRLPLGTVLVWNKKRPKQLGTFLSDCELAWMKGGAGVYLFAHVWHGADRESEKGQHLHPTQKPVAVWTWILGKMKLKAGATVLDPYMGSGSCGEACLRLGLNYIGIECEQPYFDVAKERLERAQVEAAQARTIKFL